MPKSPPILVLEDDPVIARAIVRELKKERLDCDTATSIADVDPQISYVLAIVDINLPDGNGLDLFEKLQEDGRVERGLFFSATTERGEIIRARKLGRFVPKAEGAHVAVQAALVLSRNTTPPRSGTRRSSPDLFDESTGTQGSGEK